MAKKGSHLSPGTKAKISAALRGRDRPSLSAATKAKISAASRGRSVSEATRAKISDALCGRRRKPLSAATKAKISAALRGRHASAETKAKISAAVREGISRRKAAGKPVGWAAVQEARSSGKRAAPRQYEYKPKCDG